MKRQTPMSANAILDACNTIVQRMTAAREMLRQEREAYERRAGRGRPKRRPPRGGSEPVTVEPNRPKLGQGGAAAALEYDE